MKSAGFRCLDAALQTMEAATVEGHATHGMSLSLVARTEVANPTTV